MNFLSPDPLAEQYANITPYSYCGGDPVNMADPSGMDHRPWYWDLNKNVYGAWTANMEAQACLEERSSGGGGGTGGSFYFGGFGGGGNGMELGSYYDWRTGTYRKMTGDEVPFSVVMESEIRLNGATYSTIYLGQGTVLSDGSIVSNFLGVTAVYAVMADTYVRGKGKAGVGTYPNCLDPSTIGKNLLGLSYPGGNNPRTYAGDYSYSYVPERLSEYPAIGHDRRYDNLGTAGAKGLFTDTRTIRADWRFVGEEFSIALNPFNDPVTRFQAYILGAGLGFAALPKTLFQLVQPNGLTNIVTWYNISNIGVTNTPGNH